MASSPTRRNLCGQVLHDLGSRIMAGKLQPGDPLPQEWTLCEELGVSRTVVREAVKSLAAKGLVDSRARRGTVVRPSRSWNYLDPDVLHWQVSADTDGNFLSHLMELRRTVEPAAARIAAERGADEDLQRVKAAYEQMEQQADDVTGFLTADTQFHVEILHATSNPFFAPIANVIDASLVSSLRITNRQPAENRASLAVHHKVMKAVCGRRPQASERAMHSLLTEAAGRLDAHTGAADSSP